MISPYYAEAFHPIPGCCFRFVGADRVGGHPGHCPEPPTWHGTFVAANGRRYLVDACAGHIADRSGRLVDCRPRGFRKGTALPVTRRRVSTITKSPAQRPWRSGDPLQISTLRLAQLSNSPCSPAARTDGAHRNSRDRQPGPSCPPTGSFAWPLSEAANSAWLGVAIQQLPQVMRHRSGVDVAVGHHALLSPIVAAPARLAAWCIGRAPRHGRPRPNRSGARAGAGRPTPSYLCRRNAVNTAVTR
jgi:hypothetical protein